MVANSNANRWIAEHCLSEYMNRVVVSCCMLHATCEESTGSAVGTSARRSASVPSESCVAGEDARYFCLVFRIQFVCDQ